MFQYAIGRSLALKNNDVLKLDVSNYTSSQVGITPRQYALGVFNVVENFATEDEVNMLHYKSRILRKLRLVKKTHCVEKRASVFDEKIMDIRGNVYLDGFWQTEKYFKDVAEIIKKDFIPKSPLSQSASEVLKKIEETNSISLHIRRGDYISDSKTNLFHGPCTLAYYEKAIEYILKKVDDPVFYIFSDDIEWAKKNLKAPNDVFVSQPNIKDFEEMFLMSKCKHNIIANSSFSWWGAWLNRYEKKIVVAPTPWFNANEKLIDLIPNSWIQIQKN
jgi:hypothetical protein